MRTIIFILLAIASNITFAQQPRSTQTSPPGNLSIERFEGTAVTVDLGYGIVLNKNSNLRREWFIIRDTQGPAGIEGVAGVKVIFKAEDRGIGGKYNYSMFYRITPKEPIVAFELRAIVIDVFGRLIKTLSTTELVNFAETRGFESSWRIWSENEASEAFASVVYIAQVRTASGQVYVTNRTAVFDQVRRIATRLTEADLEPKRDPLPH
jgi:hypothetical protein